MKKILLPLAMLAILTVPVSAEAAQCRNSANGQFAKCGTPGAVPASQYVAKGKSKPAVAKAAPAPTATAKPSMMSMFKPKPKPTATPATTAAKAKPVQCKDAKGKFIKCKK